MIPNKEQAEIILHKYLTDKADLDHSYLVAYGMLSFAKYYDLDLKCQNYWFVCGLLHDIDIADYNNDINQHCLVGERILLNENIDQKLIDDIKSHNIALNISQNTNIRKVLYSLDVLTGIIRAYVLMRPDKDITKTKVKSIMKKIKDKTFAASINRDQIRLCEGTLNISINNFINIALSEIKENCKIE